MDKIFFDREMNDTEKGIYELALVYLNKAVELYGPQIKGINFKGVYIHDKPAIIYSAEDFSIFITLSQRCTESDFQLVYQLAHEVCHLLHPTIDPLTGVKDSITVLNEGLSTYFSMLMASEYYSLEDLIEGTKQYSPNYFEAYLNVKNLLDIDKDIIKKLRAIEPKIDRIKPIHFEEVNKNISQNLVNQVVSLFRY
jgi:hypothetical protein